MTCGTKLGWRLSFVNVACVRSSRCCTWACVTATCWPLKWETTAPLPSFVVGSQSTKVQFNLPGWHLRHPQVRIGL